MITGLVTSLITGFALLAGMGGILPAAAQQAAPRAGSPPTVKQVASDLYFFFDYSGSNSVFLVTDAGVLVIDTREHPRAGQDLLERIRQVTNQPVKWVINSHFHGTISLGMRPFRPQGQGSWRRRRPRASWSWCIRKRWRGAWIISAAITTILAR